MNFEFSAFILIIPGSCFLRHVVTLRITLTLLISIMGQYFTYIFLVQIISRVIWFVVIWNWLMIGLHYMRGIIKWPNFSTHHLLGRILSSPMLGFGILVVNRKISVWAMRILIFSFNIILTSVQVIPVSSFWVCLVTWISSLFEFLCLLLLLRRTVVTH